MLVSARVTPLVLRSSSSMANSSSRFFSMEMVKGSILQGEAQSALAAGSGTMCSSCDFTVAEALAISTARAAQLCTPSRERSSVAAKPNAPSAMTRMPMPSDSASEALPILPFLVASERLRSSTMRASASEAPRSFAVSSAHAAISFIEIPEVKMISCSRACKSVAASDCGSAK